MSGCFQRSHRKRGFTLVEVILAVVILAMLAGTLFEVVRASLTSAAELTNSQKTRQAVFGFFHLCERSFTGLNSSATVVSNTFSEQGSTMLELDIRQAPFAFSWGSGGGFYGEISLCTHMAADKTMTLGIEQRVVDPLTGQIKPDPNWLPLLYGLQSVDWEFFDTRTGQWQDYWTDTGTHPSLINLSLVFSGDKQTWSQSFDLPALSGPPAAAATSTTSATNTTTSPPSNSTNPTTNSTPTQTNPNPTQTKP